MGVRIGARSGVVGMVTVAVAVTFLLGPTGPWADAAGASGGGHGRAIPTIPVTVREFVVVPAVDHTKRESVEFAVRNRGSETHELVLVRLAGSRPLAVDADGAADEQAIGTADAMGEAEEIAPKTTKRFTVSGLTPGAYQMFCNIVEEEDGETTSHYANGMHAIFVVL